MLTTRWYLQSYPITLLSGRYLLKSKKSQNRTSAPFDGAKVRGRTFAPPRAFLNAKIWEHKNLKKTMIYTLEYPFLYIELKKTKY